MSKHNAANERVKRTYFEHLRHARGLSDASIDPVAQALSRFEVYTKAHELKRFHMSRQKGSSEISPIRSTSERKHL